jgi:hypothetical protein
MSTLTDAERQLIEDNFAEDLEAPSFAALVESIENIRDRMSDLNLDDLQGMEVDGYDEDGQSVSIEVTHRAIDGVEKTLGNARHEIEQEIEALSSEVAGLWQEAAGRLFRVSALLGDNPASLFDWMDSAASHGQLPFWIESVMVRTKEVTDAQTLVSTWKAVVRNEFNSRFRLPTPEVFDIQPLVSAFCKTAARMTDEQGCMWLGVMDDLIGQPDTNMARRNSFGSQKALSSVEAYDADLAVWVRQNAWEQVLDRPVLVDTLTARYPVKVRELYLISKLRDMLDRSGPVDEALLDRRSREWQDKLTRLGLSAEILNPASAARPPLPASFFQWSAAQNWLEKCVENDSFGLHAIQDALAITQNINPALTVWASRIIMDMTLPDAGLPVAPKPARL